MEHQFNREGPADHAAAASLLRGYLGHRRDAELTPAGEGDFCLAFRMGHHIVRVPKSAEAEAALHAEACVLRGIADLLPLPVPRPALFKSDQGITFSSHPEIRGEVFTAAAWDAMPPLNRQRAAADLAIFLRALHLLPVQAADGCGLRTISALQVADRVMRVAPVTLYPRLSRTSRDAVHAMLTQVARGALLSDGGRSLIHCDIAPGHVLIDPHNGRLSGIIDFGDIAIGDPARDFIYVYEDFGVPFLDAVLRCYDEDAASSVASRIRWWYLLETIEWTVRMLDEDQLDAADEGISEIERETRLSPGVGVGRHRGAPTAGSGMP